MAISNLDDFKRQVKYKLPFVCIVFGSIFLLFSIAVFWNGILNYKAQLTQQDWPVAQATVSFVEEEVVDFSIPGNRNRDTTAYNIHYDYVVNEQSYSGVIKKVYYSMDIGDTLEIKYNPNAPEESTYILEPSLFFMIVGGVPGVIGITLIVLYFIFKKKNKRQ